MRQDEPASRASRPTPRKARRCYATPRRRRTPTQGEHRPLAVLGGPNAHPCPDMRQGADAGRDADAGREAAAGAGNGAERLLALPLASIRRALRSSTASRCSRAARARDSNAASFCASSAARRLESPARVGAGLAASPCERHFLPAGTDAADAASAAALCGASESAAAARAWRVAALSAKACRRAAALSLRCVWSSAISSLLRRVSAARCSLRAVSTQGAARNCARQARSWSANAVFACARRVAMRARSAASSAAPADGPRPAHAASSPAARTRETPPRCAMLTSTSCPQRAAPRPGIRPTAFRAGATPCVETHAPAGLRCTAPRAAFAPTGSASRAGRTARPPAR